jgi:hypothetical protein
VGRGLVGQPRVDLDGDPTVNAVGGRRPPGEHVAAGADVVGGDREERRIDVGPGRSELATCSS